MWDHGTSDPLRALSFACYGRDLGQTAGKKQQESEEQERARLEKDGDRHIEAAKRYLEEKRFGDSRMSVQRARLVLKKARVGREPELRQIESEIEAAEVFGIR